MARDESNGAMSVAALLRCAADNELTAEQRAQLDTHLARHPQDQGRIEHEQQLRRACSRVMGSSEQCPAALRSTLQAMCARSGTALDVDAHSSAQRAGGRQGFEADVLTTQIRTQTRQRSFWSGMARGLAIAAALAMALTLAFQVGRTSVTLQADGSEVLLAARATEYVAREHGRCRPLDDPSLSAKFTETSAEQLPAAFKSVLGTSMSLSDLITQAETVRFIDAGKCGVPGGKSLHMRLSSLTDGQEHTASLFIQEYTGKLHLAEGVSYHMAGGQDMDKPCVYVWRKDSLIYWLVCDRSDAGQLQQALSIPAVRPGSI